MTPPTLGSDLFLWLQGSFQAESTSWDACHAGDLDRQQLWQRNQERPGSASRQQPHADNVRFEDLDIYIVCPNATCPPN